MLGPGMSRLFGGFYGFNIYFMGWMPPAFYPFSLPNVCAEMGSKSGLSSPGGC